MAETAPREMPNWRPISANVSPAAHSWRSWSIDCGVQSKSGIASPQQLDKTTTVDYENATKIICLQPVGATTGSLD